MERMVYRQNNEISELKEAKEQKLKHGLILDIWVNFWEVQLRQSL